MSSFDENAANAKLMGPMKRLASRNASDRILALKDMGWVYFEESSHTHDEFSMLGLAQKYFSDAMATVEKTGLNRELLPELIGMTGRTLQRMKRFNDAAVSYNAAAIEAEKQGLLEQQLKWEGKEGKTYLAMNILEKGIPLLEKSTEFGRKLLSGGLDVKKELIEQLASLALAKADFEDNASEQLWTEAMGFLEGLEPSSTHFDAYLKYGNYLKKRRKFYSARTYLEEALEIGRQIGIETDEVSNYFLSLSDLYFKMSDFEQAGDFLVKHIDSFKDFRDKHKALWFVTECYFKGEFWAKMKTACTQLRQFLEKQDIQHLIKQRLFNANLALFDANLRYSIACRGLGEVDESLLALEAAERFAFKSGKADALRSVLGQRAIMLVERAKTAPSKMAHADYSQAVDICSEAWNMGIHDQLTAKTFIQSLIGMGYIDSAVKLRNNFAGGSQDTLSIARLNVLLADAGDGDPIKAWLEFEQESYKAHQFFGYYEALAHLYKLYPKYSNETYVVCRTQLRHIDLIRSQVNDVFSESSWLAATPFSRDFINYLDNFIDTAITLGKDEDAIFELERFRSRMLVNVLSERSLLWSRGPQKRGFLKSSLSVQYQRKKYLYAGLVARDASWLIRREVAREIEKLEVEKIFAEGLMFFSYGDQSINFPNNLQEHLNGANLAEGELFVFVHCFAIKTAVWLINFKGIIERNMLFNFGAEDILKLHHALNGDGEQQETVVNAFEVQVGQPSEDLSNAISVLDKFFVAPLVRWIQQFSAKRVFLILGSSLMSLPVDCCPSAIESNIEFCFLPTSRILGFTRSIRFPASEIPTVLEEDDLEFASWRMKESRGKMLIVLDPTRTLKYAPLEAAVVAHANKQHNVQVVDQETVVESEIEDRSGRVEILHIIGHGNFEDYSPYKSGMYLNSKMNGDSLWTNSEIFSNVDAPAGRLAVLSGCETARTLPNMMSEDVSMPSALIAAGYTTVVGSRWPVDDLSSTFLMHKFYEIWGKGRVSVCRALRESSMWLRDMSRDEAIGLLAQLLKKATEALPERKDYLKTIYEKSISLQGGSERPFKKPDYWGAFFIIGDGSITSDGADPRIPSIKRAPGK